MTDTAPSKPRWRSWLVQAASLALAGVLLWLALRGVDLGEVAGALETAHWGWAVPLVVVTLLAHAFRAWRWLLLLERLPDARERVALPSAFASVMIGYMVNYAAPRLGEVARAGHLARREKLRFTGVLGTVAAERVLDVLVLGLLFLGLPLVLLDRLDRLYAVFVQPALGRFGAEAVWALAGLVLLGLALLALVAWWLWRLAQRPDGFVRERAVPLVAAFAQGLATAAHSPHRGQLVLSTALIWLSYLAMTFVPLLMLGMAEPFDLGWRDAYALLVLGSLGVVVPSPGGVGSYHYIAVQTLVVVSGAARTPAATYAVLAHASQLLLYTLVGALCLALTGGGLRTLRRASADASSS